LGPNWVHEVKHDGYRLIVRRQGPVVRLFTRRVARAAAKLGARSFTLDGEAVVCGGDGIAVFDALHRRGTTADVALQAFDLPRRELMMIDNSRQAGPEVSLASIIRRD
jgi:ATP-dependent DNA ligase